MSEKRMKDLFREENKEENQKNIEESLKIILENNSLYTKDVLISTIELLKQRGNISEIVLKNYSAEKLVELVLTKKDYIPEIKEILDTIFKEGPNKIEEIIKLEKQSSGEVNSIISGVKVIDTKRDLIGNISITDKKICFISQKIKYKLNFFYMYVLPVFFFGGIGKVYGLVGAGLGGAFGALLGEFFDYFFNKPKKVEQYDLPLTLQAAYIDGSFQVDLNNIREVVINSKRTSIVIMSNNEKQNYGFQAKKDDIEKIIGIFHKNNINVESRKGIF